MDRAAVTEHRTLMDIRAVSRTYRKRSEEVRALRDVSFRLDVGEVVALLGPSGSGKSTLLSVMCGWELPDQGEIEWKADPRIRTRDLGWHELAIVPQTLGLMDEVSVGENVRWPVRLAEGPASRDRADDLLIGLGLAELSERYPEEVSFGEQQRAAIARALVLHPRLILADEPTSHQGEGFTRAVLAAIRSAVNGGTSCLIATHDAEVLAAADRILSIRDGELQPAAPNVSPG